MNNILTTLKEELTELRTAMHENPHLQYLMEYNFKEANSYEIINNDGKCYNIDCTTRDFPDIDFNNIIYIRKDLIRPRNTKNFKVKRDYDTIDNINGKFKRKDFDYSYEINIRKDFNVTEMIGFDRD